MSLSKNFVKNRLYYETVLEIRDITIKANRQALDFFNETHPDASLHEKEVFMESQYPFIHSDKMRIHYKMRVESIRQRYKNYEQKSSNIPFILCVISGIHVSFQNINKFLHAQGYFDFDNYICFTHFMEYHDTLLRAPENIFANEYNKKLAILRSLTQ